jgi:hypothetical protein
MTSMVFVRDRLKTRTTTEPSVPGTNVHSRWANIQLLSKESVDSPLSREEITSKLGVTEVTVFSGEMAMRWLPVGEARIIPI